MGEITGRTVRRIGAAGLTALAVLAASSDAGAQLANASAATLGVGGNATATARGFEAVSVNPAGLAMPGSGFSLAVLPVQLRSGIDPITLGDLAEVEGTVVPAGTKERWLAGVAEKGGQSGNVGVELSQMALTLGNWGFQLSTLASGRMQLAPDAVELMLYGNAGRTGSPGDFSLGGSTLEGFAVSTAGVSYAVPLVSSAGEMAAGATLKYSVGHAVGLARDRGSAVGSDPLQVGVEFPALHTDPDASSFDNGSGVGLDLGFQVERDRLSLGAAVHNVFHTFGWDAESLLYVPGSALLEQGNNRTDVEERPGAEAPAALRSALEEMTFGPTLAVGAGYDVRRELTLVADARKRFGDGLDVGPELHLGAGVEYRPHPVIQLRGGGAAITDGVQYGGGATLVMGPLHLSAAVASRRGDLDDTLLGQLTLSLGDR